MSNTTPLIPAPSTAPGACACERPVPIERAERKGAAETVCLRCGNPVSARLR
jgi:hypothetical protein